jgi:membrane associated rhomboid family serine protease
MTLLALCVLGYFAELHSGRVIEWLALWPVGPVDVGPYQVSLFRPWQLISYAFLHGGLLHLALNGYALWLFGTPLELRWGPQRFASFFVACVVGAALTHLAVAAFAMANGAAGHPVLGASGGVFGLLLAFGLLYPDVRLLLLIPPIPVKALWFVIGYGAIELAAGVTGTANGIAHFAHLGGMLTAFLLLRGRFGWR